MFAPARYGLLSRQIERDRIFEGSLIALKPLDEMNPSIFLERGL